MPGQALDVVRLKLMEPAPPEPSRAGNAPSKNRGRAATAALEEEEEEEEDSKAEASDDDARSPNLLRRGR